VSSTFEVEVEVEGGRANRLGSLVRARSTSGAHLRSIMSRVARRVSHTPETRRDGASDRSDRLRDVLVGVLSKAIGDDAEAKLSLAVALGAAGRTELPPEPVELFAFVERHLLPQLRTRVGATLASSIVDDLEAALSRALYDRPAERTARAEEAATEERPTRRAPAMETAANAVPAISGVRVPVGLYGAGKERPASSRSVLVIDADRIRRVELCRALVLASWDVTVRETCPDAGEDLGEFDLIVTEVVGVGLEGWMDTLASEPPGCAILAWTEHVDRARSMLLAAGVDRFEVVAKSARVDAVVEAADRFQEDV
jgi:hypothetical protein